MGLCRSTKATFFYYDFTFVVTFLLFSTYLLYELCLLESDFLLSSYFLDIAVYQSPWFIIFLMIFLYFIDMLACEINEEFNRWDTFLVHKLLGDKKKLSILFYTLILLTFTLCPLFSLSLLKHANLTVFLVSTSIFLLFSDLNLFLEVLKYCSLEVILGNCKDAEQNCSFLNHLLSNPLFVQHILSMFLKTSMLILCVTSRYPYILENIFRFTLVEQVTCMVTLFVFMPSFVRMLLPFSTQRISQEERKYLILDEKLTSSTRRRSYSCSSHHSSYMGRSPVNMHNLATHSMKPNFSDAKQHTVTIILIGLIILHINNHYSDLNGPSESQSSPSEVRSVLLNVSAHETTGIYNFLCDFSRVIDINLVGYFLLGLLLYRRIRLHKSINFQLINLDLPSKNDALLTEQLRESSDLLRHSNEMNNIPARSKRRIYCIDKAKDHDAENEPMPTSLSLGTDRKDSEYMSGVLNLDALTSKIKQGLGHELSDMEILKLISNGQLKTRELESVVRNPSRAVELRRLDLSTFLNNSHIIERIPYKDYDYRLVYGQCCEEVIGYIPIPVGKIGPLLLDGRSHYIPLATTEGCLVASTNRGCRAIFLAGGVKSVVYRDQMTRAPVVWFPSILESVKCIAWIDSEEGFQILKSAFDKTSAHVNLLSVFASPAGRYVHIRFAARTGDAMGMNMVSKATDSALHCLQKHFSNMQIISLSGNMCTDKKPATINTILGRGKSVIAETRLPATILAQVLHTSAYRLSRLAHAKNWIGSAMAGCPGMMGSNAHAANIIAGMFAATGQDLAQVVDSSSCLTQLEIDSSDESLIASVTMPCLEVGTVGGGTRLPGQRACLDLLDLSVDRPTEHLSRLIAGTVLAAELSLMAALDTDDLVKAHMHFNRAKPTPTNASTNPVSVTSSNLHVSSHSVHAKTFSVKNDLSTNSEISHYVM